MHIVNDFAKHLELSLSDIQVSITDLLHFDGNLLHYKNHGYLAFDLRFEVNVALPSFITFGNGKAYGFGRVEAD